MPRNGSGNYTLPVSNPVISGTPIQSEWANSTMSDVALALTNSLSRQGQGGMLAPFRFSNGDVFQPSASFTNDPTSGLYRAGPSDIRMSISGADVMRWRVSTLGPQINVLVAGVPTWANILTSSESQGTVTIGTQDFQSLRWDNSQLTWIPSSVLSIGTTGVTVDGTGGLLVQNGPFNSFGAGTDSFRAGPNAGAFNQGDNAIAIGSNAGVGDATDPLLGQGTNSVAMGNNAGSATQGANAVAIGRSSGLTTQGNNAISVGVDAGKTAQGTNSIAIGRGAGFVNQGDNGIIISSKGVAVDDGTEGHIHIVNEIASLDYTSADQWNFTGGGVTADSFTGSGADLTNISVPLVSMDAVTTPLTGAELIPVLQGSSSAKLTTSQMFGTAGQEIQGITQNRVRLASHLGATPTTYSATNNGMFSNEPLQVYFAGTGASVTQAGAFGVATTIGAAGINTGTSATGVSAARIAFGDVFFTPAIGDFDVRFLARVSALSTSGQQYRCRMGLQSSTNPSVAASGIYFEYDTIITNKWICVAENGGPNTRVVTKVQVDAPTFKTFRVQYKNNSGASGTASFYINNELVATITTNIPAFVGAGGFIASMQKTSGTASRALYLDAFSLDYGIGVTSYL